MIAMLLSSLASSALAATRSRGGPGWLLVLGPAGGGGLYFGVWTYYRNTNKSHSFESETRIEAKPVTGADTKVDEVAGTRKSGIDGDNRANHRQRVRRSAE